MKRTTARKLLAAAALAGAAALGTSALAQGYGPGYGMGYGMMGYGGYGYGHGYGVGPGMMWGYGGAYGARPGFALDMTDEQRGKIDKIQQDTASKQWELVAKLQDEQVRVNQLYYSDKRDSAAVSKSYKTIAGLRQQLFDNSLAARKQIDGVLTKEQREQLSSGGYGPWCY
jgi:Spy/CpxP family protein refolding chaperone